MQPRINSHLICLPISKMTMRIKLWALLSGGMWTTMRKGWRNDCKFLQVSHKKWRIFNCNYKVGVVVLFLNTAGGEGMFCKNAVISKFHSFSWNGSNLSYNYIYLFSCVQMEVMIVYCYWDEAEVQMVQVFRREKRHSLNTGWIQM